MVSSVFVLILFSFGVICPKWVLISAIIPPKQPPSELIADYTLNQKIPIENFYVDDTIKGNDTHFMYPSNQITSFISSATKLYQKFSSLHKKLNLPEIDREGNQQPSQDHMNVISSLPKHHWVQYSFYLFQAHITDAKIGVIGSMEPWIETSLLALGAQLVVTFEYNRLTYEHPQLQTISKSEFDSFYSNSDNLHSYDLVISMSAFDHDGLGRYGDPLNPFADFESMRRVHTLLKPGTGLLFLSVPIGADVLVWNLHRRYGPTRFPLLIADYEIVHRLGWEDRKFNESSNWRQTYEPIFILSPKGVDTLRDLPVHSVVKDKEL
jgi:hypothetical protein